MLKQDFINKLQAKLPSKTKKECGEIIDAFIEAVTDVLSQGDEVKLINFGTFKMRTIAAHDGVDPVTKKKIHVQETSVPFFKVSKTLKEVTAK